jgi:hypothetical protein
MGTNDTEQVKPYSFNLLRDEVECEDYFEDKTHEKLANSIAELIESEEGGITVGLEGSWGSGKSTVISLLKEKLNASRQIKLIQFDAWAHQGDPLRRIFLESLIENIAEDNDDNLKEIKAKISNREKSIKIKTTRSVTGLGKIISISAFLVPLGLALMSLVKNLDIAFGEKPHILFIIALIFSSAPIIVIFINVIKLLFNKRKHPEIKIFSTEYWSFLQNDSEQEVKQEVSEEEERSSIEFEKYFNKILDSYFKRQQEKSRLIIVIDNLDRVAPNDALIIWSTLQTFLQQRSCTKKSNWFNKIWIVVPYDREGLSSLWRSNDTKNNIIEKAFFDKNFQLRFEVPQQVISGWENFAQKMLKKALKGWNENEKKEVVRILRLTRKSLSDIPTPREIKNYINQLALLVYHNSGEIPIASVAYYTILRQFNNNSVNEIRTKLISGNIPDIKHVTFLPSSCIKDIAGLTFGVSPDKGNLLLLEPVIQKNLINGDDKNIKELVNVHGEDFWPVLNYHINHCSINFEEMLNYSHSIYNAFGDDSYPDIDEFISKIKETIIQQEINLEYTNGWNADVYISTIKLLNKRSDNKFILDLYNKTIIYLQNYIEKHGIPDNQIIIFYNTIVQGLRQAEITIKQKSINFVSLKQFMLWVESSLKLKINSWEWIVPSSNIVEMISNNIKAGALIPEGTVNSIKYIVDSKISVTWDILLNECQNHINYNNANYHVHSDEVFEIITLIGLNYNKNISQIRTIIISGQFLHLFYQRYTQNLYHVSIIFAFILNVDLNKVTVPAYINSNNGIQMIRNFWKTASVDNAKKVFSYLKLWKKLDFLWLLAKDKDNKLVGNIIDIITNDNECFSFFSIENGLEKIIAYRELKDNEKETEKIIEMFVKYGKIESEIIEDKDINIVENDFELFHIIKHTTNIELMKFIFDKIKNINKETWAETLKNDTYLSSLAIVLNKKNKEYELSHTYLDALVEFCYAVEKITTWQKNNLGALIDLLSIPYRKEFSKQITEYFIGQKLEIPDLFLTLLINYFDKSKIIKEENLFEDIIDEYLKNNNLKKIELILPIFDDNEIRKNYKKDTNKIKVIEDRIKDIYKTEDESNKLLLETVAKILDINYK